MGLKKMRIGNTVVTIIFIMLLIACLYSEGIFGYFDELAACISLFSIFILFFIGKLKVSSLPILVVLTILILFGFLSNFLSQLDISVFSILIDALTITKPIVIFIAAVQLSTPDYFTILRNKMNKLVKIFLLITVLFFILNQLRKVNMSDDMFGSLLNFKFIFGFSGGFGLFLYSLIPFVPDNNKSSSRIYIGIIIIMMLFTFKSQVLFFVLIFLIFYFFEFFLRTRLKVSHMAIIVILILLILYPTISNYFITSAYSPRKVLLEGALDLMKEHFPIGTGFATFASPMAAKDYSPIYIERGYYFLFGMGAFDGIQYLSDNYLAAVIGQFGFIGIILFLLETLLLIKFIISKQLGINEKIYSLTAVLALVGTTLGSSYYTSAAGALIMVVAGITVARGEN